MTKKIVLVADASHAKLYSANGYKLKGLSAEYSASDFGINHDAQHLGDGFFKKPSAGNSAHFPNVISDQKEDDRNKFSKELIHKLQEIYYADGYEEIILIAEPKMLGALRHCLRKELYDKVTIEVSKDLVHSALVEIEKQLLPH